MSNCQKRLQERFSISYKSKIASLSNSFSFPQHLLGTRVPGPCDEMLIQHHTIPEGIFLFADGETKASGDQRPKVTDSWLWERSDAELEGGTLN